MTTIEHTQRESPAFARKAGSYDAHASVQADAAAWLAEWLPHESSDRSCLELGCGTGLFSQYLADRFRTIECTDVSSEMLEQCRERLPRANYRVLDAWKPAGTHDKKWDTLYSSSLLQWAPSPVDVLYNWSQRLEENARLLLGFFVAPSLPELDQVLKGNNPVQWRSPSEWKDAINAAGLRVERMESTTHCYHYPSALEFWRSLHGTGVNVSRRLAVGTLRRLLREYEAGFTTDSGVAATWTFCRAELTV